MEMEMEMKQIMSEFFNSAIRIEQIIHIGTMCMDDAWPDIASEAFESDAEDVFKAIGICCPDEDDREEWSQALRDAGKMGWLVQFATPIPGSILDDSYSFSWGYYATCWIYDDDFYNACTKALKWHEEFIAEKKAKAKSIPNDEQ